MQNFELFAMLVVLTAACGYVNVRVLKLPPTIGLMALTLLFSVILLAIGAYRARGRAAGPARRPAVLVRQGAVARYARLPALRRGAAHRPQRTGRPQVADRHLGHRRRPDLDRDRRRAHLARQPRPRLSPEIHRLPAVRGLDLSDRPDRRPVTAEADRGAEDPGDPDRRRIALQRRRRCGGLHGPARSRRGRRVARPRLVPHPLPP